MTDQSSPPPAAARWELWRQDDNGNRDRIGVFDARADAERVLAQFEALGHKQIYWLEETAHRARLARDDGGI